MVHLFGFARDALPSASVPEHRAASPPTSWVRVGLCCRAADAPTQQRETRVRPGRLVCDLLSEAEQVSVLTCLYHGPQYPPSATRFPLPIATAHGSVLCYLEQIVLLFWTPPEHYYPQ